MGEGGEGEAVTPLYPRLSYSSPLLIFRKSDREKSHSKELSRLGHAQFSEM